MAATERQLLDAARTGSRAASAELLFRHQRQIYRFGLRLCTNEDEAREVLQETLLSAFRNLPAFHGDAKLSTWLYQIARNFCLRLRRQEGRVGSSEALDEAAADLPSPRPGPDETLHAREVGKALADAIQTLSEPNREALLLRDVEGLSAEEAARRTGIDVGALKSRLHRARLEVRARVANLLGAEGISRSGR